MEPVRARLTLILVVLAVLVLTGLRVTDQRPTARESDGAASGQLAGQPAPEPDASAIVSTAVTASGTVQTHLARKSRRHLRPAEDVVTIVPRRSSTPPTTARPRAFPLLI
jgi:hypothetical protein